MVKILGIAVVDNLVAQTAHILLSAVGGGIVSDDNLAEHGFQVNLQGCIPLEDSD